MTTILVVDDERNTREALDVILRREGHDVVLAPSAEAALAHVEAETVDLVISDVKMPVMDGLALLRRIKTQNASTVVVMMSGHNDITAAVEAIKEVVNPAFEDASEEEATAGSFLNSELEEVKKELEEKVAE